MVLFSLVLCCMTAGAAEAHIELLSPTPRYTIAESGDNKACPCGTGTSNRLCNVDGERSDSNRAVEARVTTLDSGSMLTLRFEEYVGHTGRFRVAIDYEGADLEDFNSNILLDIPDPAGSTGNIGQGSIWEIEVPLPDVACDECTLQLIQVMNGNTVDPVLDPVGKSSYYTCADIKLVGGAPLPDAGTVAASDAGISNPPPPPASGGCGCRAGGGGASSLVSLGLLLGLLFAFRQRPSGQPCPRPRLR
jgi:MYXO-CTERM domain-containing protein